MLSELPAAVVVPLSVSEYRPAGNVDVSLSVRKELEYELRYKMTSGLQGLVDDPKAKLHYIAHRYAKYIVIRYGYKLVGWPPRLPFVSFSNVWGGIETLRRLIALWDATDGMRFEPATAEDVANAIRDPDSVHPNSQPVSDSDADWETFPAPAPPAPQDAIVIPAIVLHPHSMDVLGIHPTCTQPSAVDAIFGPRPHAQRRDNGKRRCRDLTNPRNRAHLLPMEGVKSYASVLDSVSQGNAHSDAAPTSKDEYEDSEYWAGDDPVWEIVPTETWKELTLFGAPLTGSIPVWA